MVKVIHFEITFCGNSSYLEDEMIHEFGYDQHVFFSDKPNNGWMLIRLPEGYQGKTLHIQKTGYYDNFAGRLDNVYVGTKNALVFYLMGRYLPVIFIDFSIMILSLILLIISFFFKREMVYQVRYLSIFSFITSLWLILETGGYQLFTGKPVLLSNLLYITFSLIPVAFIRFLLTNECFSESRYMRTMFPLSIGGFLMVHLLQIAGVMDYIQNIFIIHILVVLMCGGIIGIYIKMRRHKEKMTNRSLFLAVFALAGFAVVDMVQFYLADSSTPTFFTQIGVLCFFIILFFFAIRNIIIDIDNRKKEVLLQQMAYNDLLTGLPNRNAFEQKMEFYRKEQSLSPIIIVMDLNGLKGINDTYGHRQGDSALISLAGCIKECFLPSADIFRIGGDEFCIMLQDVTEEEIQEKLKKFKKICEVRNRENNVSVAAAIGWSFREAGEDVEKVFSRADAKMYENKKIMKSKHSQF